MKKWKEVPIVKFMHLINEQEWFKLSKGTFSQPLHNPAFDNATVPLQEPTCVTMTLIYGDAKIEMTVSHYNGKYCYQRRTPRNMKGRGYTRTKILSKMVEIVADDYERILDGLDEQEVQRQRQDTYEKRCQAKAEEIAKELGLASIRMTSVGNLNILDEYGTETTPCMSFQNQLSKKYNIRFLYEGKLNQPLAIRLNGDFTLDESKQICDLLSSLPSVMADRIKNGK